MRDLAEVQEWIRKAENDFEGALDLARRRKHPLPDLVCFHCQQAAEKYLKAVLIRNEQTFPKTHDLILLFELCLRFAPTLEVHRELFEILNPYSVQFHYPGEETTVNEARTAVRAMREIRALLTQLLPT